MMYLHLDTDALDGLPPAEAYRAATQIHHQAKRLGAAYADQLAATLAAQHGQARAADMLGIAQSTLAGRVSRYRKETTMQVITRSENPTQLPALSHMYKEDTLYVEAITDVGVVADAVYRTTDRHGALNQLAAEITPWLPTLEALKVEADARRTAGAIDTEITWALQAEGVADQADRAKTLAATVDRHRTSADEGANVIQVADAIVARLKQHADQAHQRAIAAAPGEVPELLLWTTPKSQSNPARPLTGWLKSRLP